MFPYLFQRIVRSLTISLHLTDLQKTSSTSEFSAGQNALYSTPSRPMKPESKMPGRHLRNMAMLNEFNLADSIALLSRTPATLNALLRGLPNNWVRCNEGNDSWSAFDIVGHLIVGERTDWMPRVRIILEHGDAQAFHPFDRFAQEKESHGKSLEQLLDEFARLRKENLNALQALNLQPQDFTRRGKHPGLGVVTLSELLATWTVHDFTHLHQLSRVIARQYRDEVGPWKAYLGVLHCSAHSA